jgi:hypothetical protein
VSWLNFAGGGVEFRRHNTAILPRNRAPNTYKTYSSLKVRLMPKKVRLMPKKVRLMPKRPENVKYLRRVILFRSASCHALKGGCPLGGGRDIPQKNPVWTGLPANNVKYCELMSSDVL